MTFLSDCQTRPSRCKLLPKAVMEKFVPAQGK